MVSGTVSDGDSVGEGDAGKGPTTCLQATHRKEKSAPKKAAGHSMPALMAQCTKSIIGFKSAYCQHPGPDPERAGKSKFGGDGSLGRGWLRRHNKAAHCSLDMCNDTGLLREGMGL